MKPVAAFSIIILAIFLPVCGDSSSDQSVLVGEGIEISEEVRVVSSIPRFLPEGEDHEFDAIGFKAADGTFYPVIPASYPIPRWGSTGPVDLGGKTIRVLQGRDPKISGNELLGEFVAEKDLDEVTVSFSMEEGGLLRLAIESSKSNRAIPLSRVGE